MRCRDLGAVVGGVGRRLWLWGRGLRSRWIDLAGGGRGGERGRTYAAAALPTVLLGWQRTKTPSPAERFVWFRTVAAAGKGVFATPSLSRATFRRSDVFQVDRGSGIGVPGWGVAGSVVRGLSVFSYRGSPLPSSLTGLISDHWALGTGRWVLGVGHRVFDARLSALSFRLSVCDLSLSASGVRFLVLNAVYAGWP